MDDLKVCRICLRTDKFAKYYKLEEFYLKCYYEEITTIPVNVNDGLPKYFCYQCSTILNKYHFFKEKCCFAQRALIQMARVAPLTYDKICNMYSRKHPIIKRGIIEILKADKKVKTFNFQEELQMTPETKTKVLNIDSECDNFESNDDLYADSVQISDNDDELKRKDSPARITYMEEEKSNDKLEEEPVVYEKSLKYCRDFY
ncbi:unnamed protein product [Diatraea saccharalis]|uniref:ZAD domain-containing protein n=1 Tax=Diatraea saccharalis TaxID=40085 RepID=A0A9N9WJ24_9NEOP|nr:unnamed protein product [Diatraea saccharalis]